MYVCFGCYGTGKHERSFLLPNNGNLVFVNTLSTTRISQLLGVLSDLGASELSTVPPKPAMDNDINFIFTVLAYNIIVPGSYLVPQESHRSG
ncbi:hypothetical protein PoB_003861500 [Plakobranchus ocellatus]|uniref:Uncharacterized protein n=1 Tax=Plakobranchus ocellatus TaxID=259542 RepID=A0AAV4AXV9_9GAST|nr:hypothetical protein PoB_003861500 [Plakobranchus ocellatus]